ncbi:MAG: hypothetical protein ABIO39_01855 [Caulobacteraceae bacterium]
MTDRLDHLMAGLAAAPTDHTLDGFDGDVARGVARQSAEARAAASLTPARIVSVGLALAIGVTAGGVAAASAISTSKQFNSFAVHPHLAPSTLLEGGR